MSFTHDRASLILTLCLGVALPLLSAAAARAEDGCRLWLRYDPLPERILLIPDFGGFLIKANSEGQPGPRTYHRSHVEGATVLAAALAPHHGVVSGAPSSTTRSRATTAPRRP